jgi:hypothetical protein
LPTSLANGEIAGVSYSQGNSPGLTIRPARPILCARTIVPTGNLLKRVVLDPNGYYEPIPLAMQAMDVKDGLLNYGESSFLRASDAMRFSSSAFTVLDQQLALDVDGVSGYCFLAPAVDTPPAAINCEPSGIKDELFAFGDFEALPQGTVQLTATSEVIPPLNTEVAYEYVLRAVNGPVFNVRLREQFPYFLASDPVNTIVYQKSMQLEHNWTCSGSSGSNCDSRGAQINGAGYVHLDGGMLAEGSCLKITTTRQLRTDGPEVQSSFSGRLHAGAVYTTAPGVQTPASTTHVALRQPFAQ